MRASGRSSVGWSGPGAAVDLESLPASPAPPPGPAFPGGPVVALYGRPGPDPAEVVAMAARAWREGSLDAYLRSLVGSFALVLHDPECNETVLARDRLGQRPLFYSCLGGELLAGSCLSRLTTAIPRSQREVDPSSLDLFLACGYLPGEHTLLRGIRRVMPGTRVQVAADGTLTQMAWWDLRYTVESSLVAADERARGEHLVACLDGAARRVRGAEEKLGCFVSGGMDSSTNLMMQVRAGLPVEAAYTVAFHDDRYDELPYSRVITEHARVPLEVLYFEDSMFTAIDDVIREFGEPLADDAAVPTRFLLGQARERIQVVLSGEGGDEFMGLPRHNFWKIREVVDHLAAGGGDAGADLNSGMAEDEQEAVRSGVMAMARQAYRSLPYAWRTRFLKAVDDASGGRVGRLRHRVLDPADESADFVDAFSVFDAPMRRAVIASDLRGATHETGAREFLLGMHRRSGSLDVLERVLYGETRMWLVDGVLRKDFVMAEQQGLEVRFPFLDAQVLGFVAGMDRRQRYLDLNGKRLLKYALREILPRETLEKPKHVFLVPVTEWARSPAGRRIQEVLTDPSVARAGMLDGRTVERLLSEHRRGQQDHGVRLWTLLCLEIWRQHFLG